MKIFLDTADIQAIKRWNETGILDGVTTNPSLLLKAGGSPREQIAQICSLVAGDVSVEVTELDAQAVYAQAQAISKIAKNVVVKIPCHVDYYPIIGRLISEGVRINVTLVFSLIQGLAMAKLGATYISPFIGRWDDIDVEGASLLSELRVMIDQYGFETQILAASIRSVRHMHHAIMAGSDVATVPSIILERSLHHVLTDQGIEKFNADWAKTGVKQFP